LHVAWIVQVVAAIPAVALLVGCALGLIAPALPHSIGSALMLGATVSAAAAWRTGRARWLIAFVLTGFAVGGSLLASDSWHRAHQSTLRAAFEQIARAERAEAEARGRVLPTDPSAFALVEGRLRADASPGPSGLSLNLSVDRIQPLAVAGPPRDVGGGLLVTVGGGLAALRSDEWRAGRRVRLPAELHRAARYLDDGVPDGERALEMRGIALVASAKSGALVEVLSRGPWIDEAMAAARASARRAIADGVGRWSRRSAAIVSAIVIGDRAGLDEEVQRRLQEAGTYHVLAISGGNIAILAGLMLAAFRFAGMLGRTAMIASLILLAAYGYFVGGGASVDRATLMAAVYFAARAADLRSPPLNALAFVAACLLGAQPFSAVDPAFVLTFGATLSILSTVPAQPWIRIPRFLKPAVSMFAASAATEAMLFPIGALFFARVTFAGLVLNFVAIPLMALAQIAGMVAVPVALVSTSLGRVPGFLAHIGAEGLVRSAGFVEWAPATSFHVAPPSWPIVAIYYAAVVTAWRLRRNASRASRSEPRAPSNEPRAPSNEPRAPSSVYRVPAIAVALVSAVWILAEPWTVAVAGGDDRLPVSFVDVGQGDSAFVRFPRGATMLADAGGLVASSGLVAPAFDIGDRVVAPVLRAAGVRRLDYLVLSHGDPDHIGGATAIVEEFRPRQIWEGIPVPRFEQLVRLRSEAHTRGLSWLNVRAGDRFDVDGVTVAVLHPDPPDWERQRVRNDDSIVLELRWRNASFWLTGDVGKAVERVLPSRMTLAPLRVIKVPHHGSLTSSSGDFVRAIQPTIAVVSAGRSNHFGHPAAEVLQRYRDAGTEIFRTDQDGEVSIETDGYSIDAHTFMGRQLHLSSTPAYHDDTKTTKP
jgi:competence protein ComEC